MASRHTERSKNRCNSVSPIPKRKLAYQIDLRARYFTPGISKQRFVKRGHKGPALNRSQIANGEILSDVRFTPESGHVQRTRSCLLWANSGHRTISSETESKPVGVVSPNALTVLKSTI